MTHAPRGSSGGLRRANAATSLGGGLAGQPILRRGTAPLRAGHRCPGWERESRADRSGVKISRSTARETPTKNAIVEALVSSCVGLSLVSVESDEERHVVFDSFAAVNGGQGRAPAGTHAASESFRS